MIDGLKPYADRRDSGLPWLGKIPAHWEVRRNGRLFVQRNETGFPDLPILEVSLKTGVRVRDFEGTNRKQVMSDREKYKRTRQGDIAYNMMRLWQGAVGTSPVDGLVSPAYVVAKPLPQTDSRYYQYLFRTGAYMDEVNKFSRGIVSDRNRLYWEDFKQMPSPFPPPEEQAAIVRFLDHADRRIRRYIRAKRQLIALLNEQKQAIIHRAVTRGLDPHVKLKPSGVEWLGDVPEEWEVKRAKYLFREVDERSTTGSEELLSVSHKTGVTPRKKNVTMFLAQSNVGHKICRPGDLAINTMWAYMAALGISRQLGLVSPSYGVYRPRDSSRFAPEYIDHLLRVEGYKSEYLCRSSGITSSRLRLYPEDFLRIPIVIPPVSEQSAIALHIESEAKEIQSAIDRTESEIELLREYRTCVIADVVSGKLDVREAAGALSDELEAVEPDAEELLDEDETTDDAELDTEPEEVEA